MKTAKLQEWSFQITTSKIKCHKLCIYDLTVAIRLKCLDLFKAFSLFVFFSWRRFKGLEVYKFSRGTGSARDCSDQCRRDTSCYAFNYVKLSKWCYLGYTHSRSLRYVANGKMASGYRRCSAHSTNEEWISEIYTVAGAPSTLSATKTDTSASISYSVGAAGNPVETYSVKCVIFGLSCNNAAIGTSLSYPRSTLSIPVSGLSANTEYYCYVVATNSVGAVCSAALEVTTCATGEG